MWYGGSGAIIELIEIDPDVAAGGRGADGDGLGV
jgi:hypothetical protein